MARKRYIKIRGGTAAEWTAANPVLGAREPGLETDTGRLKFGNGVTAWNSLAYSTSTGPSAQIADFDQGRLLLPGGETTSSRFVVNPTANPANNNGMSLSYFRAARTEAIDEVQTITAGVAATTPTLCRVGIYSINETTFDGTLVAAIANDATLWTATNTIYTRSLTSVLNKVAGQIYAVGFLVVGAAAFPTFVGVDTGAASTVDSVVGASPPLCRVFAASGDLPASFLHSATLPSRRWFYAALLP